jgi:calcium permeable stress-gated cation channel
MDPTDGGNDSDWPHFETEDGPMKNPGRDWLDLISNANSYLTVHLLFTYLFTLLVLYFVYKNYRRFIRSRQLFSLEHVHSIPARTVMVTNLPDHLRNERALAEYFENMNLSVESVSVCREVGTLKDLLDARTKALLTLESKWVNYVGNPSSVESYDPSDSVMPPLNETEFTALEANHGRVVVPSRKRPTLRPGWFRPKVDALEYLEARFKDADEKVKKWRRSGKFKSTHAAFVTFEKMSSAVSTFSYCPICLYLNLT